jgi:hypothetical protein
MAYEPRSNPGNRLGIHATKIEKRRDELGLDEKGFRQDGDAAGADKEEMLKALYRRENDKLPPGLGGTSADAASDEDAEPE